MSFPQFSFPQQRLDARHIEPGGAQTGDRFRLPGAELEAQAKNLFGEFSLASLELGGV
jgi:hypothetical protein